MNDPIAEAAAAKAKLDRFTADLHEHAGRVLRLYQTMKMELAPEQSAMALPNAAMHLQGEMAARLANGTDPKMLTDHLVNVCVTLASLLDQAQQPQLRSKPIERRSGGKSKGKR